MIAIPCILALAFAATDPPADHCQVTDNRCKAQRSERRAAAARAPDDRALYLHSAHRAYLSLFDKTGDQHDLCAARRTFDASLAVTEQSPAQRASFEADRDALVAREREHPPRCSSVARQQRPRRAAPPRVTAPPTEAVSPDRGASAATDRAITTGPAAPPEPTVPDVLMPVRARPGRPQPIPELRAEQPQHGPRRMQPLRDADEPRPGRGLVIAGGVTLGVGIALTATAGALGHRMHAARQAYFDLHDAFGRVVTTSQKAMATSLLDDYRRMGPPTVALAVAGATTIVVSAVLASVGGRRMARVASRAALVPVPGGLALHARF